MVILITGLIKIRRSINALIRNHNFVYEFRQKFIELITPYLQRQQSSAFERSTQPLDGQLYHWLVAHMDKTQRLLGFYGRAHYTAPFGRFQVANYEYIINTINQIATGDAEPVDLSMCDNMMVRYIGAMKRIIDDKEKGIKNPIMWLQQGIQFYIGLPIRLLNWFGIISETSFEKIVSSKFFQVLAGVAGLAGFIASLVTILQGWPAIKDLLNNLKK